MWYERVRGLEEDGEFVVLGLVQEQHPDRASLFAQWQGFDFPILWDPFNLTGSTAVPNRIAIDEHGVVRAAPADLNSIEAFVEAEFPDPQGERPWWPIESPERLGDRVAEWQAGLEEALAEGREDEFTESHPSLDVLLSDLLWLDPATSDRPDRALQLLGRWVTATQLSTHLKTLRSAEKEFRYGVALRLAYDAERWTAWIDREPPSALPRPPRVEVEDAFQESIDAWRKALELDPNQYIYRRRIQQYGPREDKPYPFYDWVARAEAEVRARGEEPVRVRVPLTGSELAGRQAFAEASAIENPDPDGKIDRADDWVDVRLAAAADTTGRSRTTRVHVVLSLASEDVHWNNEAEPLTVWVDLPAGWSLDPARLSFPNPSVATSHEDRNLDFEVRAPDVSESPTRVSGFALFNVCETADGRCLYRRCDFEVEL